MPQTLDEYPGLRIEDEGVLYVSQSLVPQGPGEVRFVSGSGFQFWDNDGQIKHLFTGSIDPTAHAALHQLIHFLDDGPGNGFGATLYKEIIGIPFPTRVTWWGSPAKTSRIFQVELTRSNFTPVTQSYKVYNADGVTLATTATDVITYVSGVFETSRTRTFT
jgi:hypothetical protein